MLARRGCYSLDLIGLGGEVQAHGHHLGCFPAPRRAGALLNAHLARKGSKPHLRCSGRQSASAYGAWASRRVGAGGTLRGGVMARHAERLANLRRSGATMLRRPGGGDVISGDLHQNTTTGLTHTSVNSEASSLRCGRTRAQIMCQRSIHVATPRTRPPDPFVGPVGRSAMGLFKPLLQHPLARKGKRSWIPISRGPRIQMPSSVVYASQRSLSLGSRRTRGPSPTCDAP